MFSGDSARIVVGVDDVEKNALARSERRRLTRAT